MRLLIVGTMEGYITAAGKIAHDRGAKVAYTDGIDKALNALRGGQGADLVMIDVKFDIAAPDRRAEAGAYHDTRDRLRHRHGCPGRGARPSAPAPRNTSRCHPMPS